MGPIMPRIADRFRGFLPVVVDVETGGFNAATDALLEVAACIIRMDDFGRLFVAETIDVNVEPFAGANLDPKSLEITGIQVDNPLRGALPDTIELIPGPGCPVCICPEEDVFEAIQLALHEDIILVAFGDMLRVPVNVPKKDARSLEQARALGADIRPIASPVEATSIAREHPDTPVVFFAAGFETTTAPVAAMLVEGAPDNLYVLLSGRLTWPAVAMLLDSGEAGFDALIAPGHVATVMGPEEWKFVVDEHKMPAAIAGFTTESLLAAIYSVMRQLIDDRYFLDNVAQWILELDRGKGIPW